MDYSGYNVRTLYNKIRQGDVVKFKYIYEIWSEEISVPTITRDDNDLYDLSSSKNTIKEILTGQVKALGKNSLLYDDNLVGIKTNNDTLLWISYSDIVQWIPENFLSKLTIRTVLRNMWTNLIFREIKTVKTKKLESVHYKYINSDGLLRTKIFRTLDEAYYHVPRKYHRNIQPCYQDYYGFTTDNVVRPSDPYHGREIFFSRKCHTEIDMTTGIFQNERSTNKYPPVRNQYICGLVENGEKGLFFRKWFLCSDQFITLWTMLCDPESKTLRYRNSQGAKIKTLAMLYRDLSCKHYQIDYESIIEDRANNYRIANFEKTALYQKDIYINMAKAIFENKYQIEKLYDDSEYRHNFYKNVMWMTKWLK